MSRMNPWKTASMSLVVSASLGLADDFKTIDGKIYKDATISHVEADGIVIKTKTGISKIYFIELPKDVQERFHYGSATHWKGSHATHRQGRKRQARHPVCFGCRKVCELCRKKARRAGIDLTGETHARLGRVDGETGD